MARLYIPQEAAGDLAQLLSLTDDQIRKLTSALDSGLATQGSGAILEHLSRELGCSYAKCWIAWGLARFIGGQRSAADISDETVIDDLVGVLEAEAPGAAEQVKGKREVLLDLFAPKPQGEHFAKLHRLRWGPLRAAQGFRSVCDIRPVFDEAREDIVGAFPVSILAIDCQNESGDKETIVVQLNDESMARLKESLETLERKLSKLGPACDALSKSEKGGG
jgi:hypothetical protein